MDFFKDILDFFSFFDLVFIIITILSLIKCTRKGFVLSVLSASKWLLAYVITLILFPKARPYVEDVIDNEYILDVTLGISIFVIVIFIILLINKGISKTVKYTGLGKLDTLFGFLFGFVRGYIVCVCLFATINIIYNSEKWPVDADKSFTFSYIEKGSNYLIREFPNEKNYEDAKDKVQEL
tara:strand:+ start:653 stop:1195 length:543 start_codon:yes stop_codon:yes gene_type:complete